MSLQFRYPKPRICHWRGDTSNDGGAALPTFTSIAASVVAFMLSILCASIAQDGPPPGIPSDCFLSCKEEYSYLDAFDQNTPDESIVRVFGPPKKIGGDRNYRTERYIGEAVELLVLRSAASKAVVGIGVRALENKGHLARIPYMGMGRHDEKTKATKWMYKLTDYSLSMLQGECEGSVDADARYHFIWTPSCYFGRPGRYMNYSFLFDQQSCDFPMDKVDFKRIKCKNSAQINPAMVFVTREENAQALAHYFSGLVYWGE